MIHELYSAFNNFIFSNNDNNFFYVKCNKMNLEFDI